jgi:hypothetical protein
LKRERRFTPAEKIRSHWARRLSRRTLMEKEVINDSDGVLAPL